MTEILGVHFNPRSPCGERLYSAYNFPLAQGISIHAPRAGSDSANPGLSAISRNFNPRSPCGERRENGRECGKGGKIFQSTLPVRGATILLCFVASMFYISIHAPRAGSDIAFRIGSRILVVISIHAPRAGSDEKLTGNGNAFVAISIHAPRAGSDSSERSICTVSLYFNPRSPCGERRAELSKAIREELFQSTLPVRGATAGGYSSRRLRQFQSTLPVRGATMQSMLAHRAEQGFQSTLPVRGATRSLLTWKQRGCISIHAPRAGSDDDTKQEMERAGISIHAPRAGSDSFFSSASRAFVNFNPRSPCGERQPYLFSTLRAEHISIHAPRAGSDRSGGGSHRPLPKFQSTLPVRGATVKTRIIIRIFK